MRVYLEGIGILGPGLEGWAASRAILLGEAPYAPKEVNPPPIPLLPPNERRRLVTTVKLALAVGAESLANAGRDPGTTATVFTSSGGDGDTIHGILEALASEEREVSPTRFHNSVHNAPSGYWTIANRNREPTTSLCAHDASFAVGLLDAAAQATVDDRAVALIAYDLPYPEPLNARRPIVSTFAVALVLTPQAGPTSIAQLTLALDRGSAEPPPMHDPRLEALRAGNPAARSLPMLAAIARGTTASVALEHVFGNVLKVTVGPANGASGR